MKIAVLGHSQTRYLNFNRYTVKKFFKSGATFKSITETTAFQHLVSYKPDLIFLLLGSNDIRENYNHSTISNTLNNYQNLKEEILIRINPIKGTYTLDIERRTIESRYSSSTAYRKIRNSIIKNIKKIDRKSFLPYRPVSGLLESDIGPDGIHVNEKGAKKIVDTIQQKIEEILN